MLRVNCFESLKSLLLQHKDETCLSVNVTKVEKKAKNDIRLNPKCLCNGYLAATSRIEKGSTTIPLWGSKLK